MHRAESVRKQLNGELATSNADQLDKDKEDASGIHLKEMGAFVPGEDEPTK